ncbi:MoaD family protein [Streptomyces netropsis]|uniref:Molybdopterin converting factor small subunit n=1 Tax=Streptomyces syringium TaxID=76729 RepID=A0ABS4Y754_9ACTN|nr:MoaD/ThiS family protein [Streptomyces syringium]MBP2404619.1 molybdopterin converting factor small subunit [Streptomyces syringium]SPE57563.1 MoaD family protein [Streptomyces netropsis]
MILRFSGIMLRLVNYERTVQVEADTLGAALEQLESRHPQLRHVLRDANGQIRRTHQLFLNGERVAAPDLGMPLEDSDEVEFLTAIAGG